MVHLLACTSMHGHMPTSYQAEAKSRRVLEAGTWLCILSVSLLSLVRVAQTRSYPEERYGDRKESNGRGSLRCVRS